MVFDLLCHLTEYVAFRGFEVFLLILAEEIEQVNMGSRWNIEIQVTEPSSLALSAVWVGGRLLDAAKRLYQVPAFGSSRRSDCAEHLRPSSLRQFLQPSGKHVRFDKYHIATFPISQCGIEWQGVGHDVAGRDSRKKSPGSRPGG